MKFKSTACDTTHCEVMFGASMFEAALESPGCAL